MYNLCNVQVVLFLSLTFSHNTAACNSLPSARYPTGLYSPSARSYIQKGFSRVISIYYYNRRFMLTGRFGADPNVALSGSSGSSNTLVSTSTQFSFNSSSTILSGARSPSTSWSGNLPTTSSSSSQSSSSSGASSISSTWSSSQLSNTKLSTFPSINPSSSTQMTSSQSSTSSDSISMAAGF